MTSDGKQLYCLVQNDEMGVESGMIEFADMDRDGMVDIVTYEQATQSIVTYYNRHQANSASEVNLCKGPVGDIKTYLGEANRFFVPFSQASSLGVDRQKLNDTLYLNTLPEAVDNVLPGRLRIGDIDADGFPDILVTHQAADLKSKVSVIYLNKQHETSPAITPSQ